MQQCDGYIHMLWQQCLMKVKYELGIITNNISRSQQHEIEEKSDKKHLCAIEYIYKVFRGYKMIDELAYMFEDTTTHPERAITQLTICYYSRQKSILYSYMQGNNSTTLFSEMLFSVFCKMLILAEPLIQEYVYCG